MLSRSMLDIKLIVLIAEIVFAPALITAVAKLSIWPMLGDNFIITGNLVPLIVALVNSIAKGILALIACLILGIVICGHEKLHSII